MTPSTLSSSQPLAAIDQSQLNETNSAVTILANAVEEVTQPRFANAANEKQTKFVNNNIQPLRIPPSGQQYADLRCKKAMFTEEMDSPLNISRTARAAHFWRLL
jgi:hypothetical protein